MKINEFVEMYTNNPRINIEKELEVKKYISIAHKRDMASLILDNCTSIVDGEIHIDSVERYILFIIAVISIHTNLEFVNEDDEDYGTLDAYDLLCESGLLVKIIDTFKDDYASCQEVLNMMTTDMLQGNITIEKSVYRFLDSILEIISNATNVLVDKLDIDSLDGLKSIDQEKLMQLYNLIDRK